MTKSASGAPMVNPNSNTTINDDPYRVFKKVSIWTILLFSFLSVSFLLGMFAIDCLSERQDKIHSLMTGEEIARNSKNVIKVPVPITKDNIPVIKIPEGYTESEKINYVLEQVDATGNPVFYSNRVIIVAKPFGIINWAFWIAGMLVFGVIMFVGFVGVCAFISKL